MSVAAGIIGTKNFTMVTVAKFVGTAAPHCIVNATAGASGWVMGVNVATAVNVRDLTALGSSVIGDTTNNATTNWEAWIFESDSGSNLTFSVNNVSHSLSATPVTGAAAPTSFCVGTLNSGADVMLGPIWEIIGFPTKLGAADRASLVAYLSADTGLF
jgi:hypothetical protein